MARLDLILDLSAIVLGVLGTVFLVREVSKAHEFEKLSRDMATVKEMMALFKSDIKEFYVVSAMETFNKSRESMETLADSLGEDAIRKTAEERSRTEERAGIYRQMGALYFPGSITTTQAATLDGFCISDGGCGDSGNCRPSETWKISPVGQSSILLPFEPEDKLWLGILSLSVAWVSITLDAPIISVGSDSLSSTIRLYPAFDGPIRSRLKLYNGVLSSVYVQQTICILPLTKQTAGPFTSRWLMRLRR